MRRLSILSIALAATLASAGGVHAQFAFRGVEFWGGQYGWSGPDADGLQAGFQGAFAGYGEFSERLAVGLELGTGGFDVEQGSFASRWDETAINAVGRISLLSRRGISPFVEGTFGWTRISTAFSDGQGGVIDFTENGLAVGGELGVEVPLNRRARIVLAGGATQNFYGDAELSGSGIVLEGTGFSALRWGFRAGISLGRMIG